jgi:phenylalanyl-tRNA synthetase alpha chain
VETIQQLLDEAERAIAKAQSTADLQAVETHYLGRKGAIGQLLRQLGTLPPEQRPQFGQQGERRPRTLGATLR